MFWLVISSEVIKRIFLKIPNTTMSRAHLRFKSLKDIPQFLPATHHWVSCALGLHNSYIYMFLLNPSVQAGCNTRWSLTGLNSEFSFSKTAYHTKVKEQNLPYNFIHSWRHSFSKVLVLYTHTHTHTHTHTIWILTISVL